MEPDLFIRIEGNFSKTIEGAIDGRAQTKGNVAEISALLATAMLNKEDFARSVEIALDVYKEQIFEFKIKN